MANEARVNSTLTIKKTTSGVTVLAYQSRPSAFRADVAGSKGPTPGSIDALTTGTNVDLSELVQPGLCQISNQDATNWYELGIFDTDNNQFFPLLEVLPGESYVIRLSRNLLQEYGTGTGTTGTANNSLRVRANSATVDAFIGAFEV